MITQNSSTTAHESKADILAGIFHTLAQPLTELRGTLELALARPLNASEFRGTLTHCVEAVDRINASLCFARDLADAEEPGAPQATDLSLAIRNVFEEFRPVAQDQNIELQYTNGSEIWIDIEPSRLSRALTLVIDAVLAASQTPIRLEPIAHGWQLRTVGGQFYFATSAQRRSLELARALLKSAQCSLEFGDGSVVAITVGDQGAIYKEERLDTSGQTTLTDFMHEVSQ